MSGGPDSDPILIIGSGLTGGKAAVTLREEGFDGRLILLGSEAGVPFGRPPLSKEYLRGDDDLSGWTVKPGSWYSGNQVELLVDNFETAIEGQDYMRQRSASDKNPVGIDFDPEELVKKIHTGLRLEELQSINA